jgi:antitoxin component YwqK of YwqJK toxin-antitoxin module
MRTLLFIFALAFATSCDNDTQDGVTKEALELNEVVEPDELVQVNDGVYFEYYPNGKSIKFTGPQDENGKRNGKWSYYSEDGRELSMTMYKNGLKHGHSIVKYPDGTIHYYGEYADDKKIGVWKSYNERGKLETEMDYDTIK